MNALTSEGRDRGLKTGVVASIGTVVVPPVGKLALGSSQALFSLGQKDDSDLNHGVIISLLSAVADLCRISLESNSRSPLTRRAHDTDLRQLHAWLEANIYAPAPVRVERPDIITYLATLAAPGRGLAEAALGGSGVCPERFSAPFSAP